MEPVHRHRRKTDWQAIAASVALHLLLFALVIYGVPKWSKPLPPRGPVITGSLVESPSAARQAEQARQQREEAERQARLAAERKAREEAEQRQRDEEARQRRKAEEQKQREETARKAKAAAEQKAREETARKEKEAAEQKAKEEAARKAEAERKAKEEAERKAKEEAERKRQAEEERKRKAAEAKAKAERERKAKEAAELKARQQALANELAAEQDAMDRNTWSSRLAAHIQKHWVRPAGSSDGFSCVVRIQQSRYGDVLARSIQRSCGNDFLDNSVLEAVDAASPLPLPRNPRVFDATVDIVFVPF